GPMERRSAIGHGSSFEGDFTQRTYGKDPRAVQERGRPDLYASARVRDARRMRKRSEHSLCGPSTGKGREKQVGEDGGTCFHAARAPSAGTPSCRKTNCAVYVRKHGYRALRDGRPSPRFGDGRDFALPADQGRYAGLWGSSREERVYREVVRTCQDAQ